MKDLPSKFVPLRHKLLSYASYLANLPAEDLSEYLALSNPSRATAPGTHSNKVSDAISCPAAKYLVGWSHGKEALRSGHYDTLKGSYYVNCAFYQDPSLQNAPGDSFPNFPEYTAPNIWPSEKLLPGFRETFEELCTLIIDTAVLVAKACDRYAIQNVEGYEAGYLEHVVKTSLTTKARLLHYFPPEPSDTSSDTDPDSWCATHLDHGCLTGLTSALYIPSSPPLPPLTSSPHFPPLLTLPHAPDPLSGLYIHSRTSTTTRISIPADSLGFQTGEALEVITGGKFRAVPHFVRGPRPGFGDGVARNTLAVFTQPNLGAVVDRRDGVTFGEFARGVVGRHG